MYSRVSCALLMCSISVFSLGPPRHPRSVSIYAAKPALKKLDKVLSGAKKRWMGNFADIMLIISNIEYFCAGNMEPEDCEKLEYAKAQLADLSASDWGRDDAHLCLAIKRYKALLQSKRYGQIAAKRLVELNSVKSYLKLEYAVMFLNSLCGEIAALKLCQQILDDPDAKPEIRKNAMLLIECAEKRLGVDKD